MDMSIDWSRTVGHLTGSFDNGKGPVVPLDVVDYQFGKRRGILLEPLADGDAFVLFRDTKQIERVRCVYLAKVPLFDEVGPR